MNTLQIDTCMSSAKTFVGTYPADKLPSITTYTRPFSFIANTDPSYMSGTHWVAFFVTDNCVEIFDSYGREMCPLFKNYTVRINHVCNDKQVQQIGTSVCGQHCIFYIYQRERGLSMEEIMAKFKNLNENDIAVRNWVDERFGCKSIGRCTEYSQSCVCFTH